MSNEPMNTRQNKPGMSFGLRSWANLSYLQKFTVVAIIFALSVLAFLPLILEQQTRIENYGRKESQGTAYLGFLWQLTSDLQLLYQASIELANGAGTQAALDDAQLKVDADIIALESADNQYGRSLNLASNLQDIKNKWGVLRQAVQDKDLANIESGYVSLSSSIDGLITNTGNKSYLILDPDLDTYYVMDTVLLNMPENKTISFQIWKLANEAAVSQSLTPEKQFELAALVSRLKSNTNRLDQNLQTSIENNKNGAMEPILIQPLEQYLSSNQSFIDLITTYLSDTEAAPLNSQTLKDTYQSQRDSSELFYAAAAEALTKGLETRTQSLTFRLGLSILMAALSILIAYIIGGNIMRTISRPLLNLLSATQKLSAGDMSTRIPATTSDEAGQVAQAFNTLAEELDNNRQTLQNRALELERRSSELETIAEVARDISIIRDLNTMLNVATSLIRERFSFYHTGIFLVDERNEYAVLRSANGSLAQNLLDQKFKIRVGSVGVVGKVTQNGQAQIDNFSQIDTSVQASNEFPETRSEIGLPLRSKNLTIGVLNIHSTIDNAFTNREVQIFQILADQLSAAIDNAQLAEQLEGTLNQLNVFSRIQTKRNWDVTTSEQELGFEYDGIRIQAVPQNLPSYLMNQLENGKPIILKEKTGITNNGDSTGSSLLVPILLSGQVIGVIGLERDASDTDWTSEEISIAEAAANRAAITLENVRLLEDSQRRATKERTISEATARISSALSVENILGIAAEELERVVGETEVILQIKPDVQRSSE